VKFPAVEVPYGHSTALVGSSLFVSQFVFCHLSFPPVSHRTGFGAPPYGT